MNVVILAAGMGKRMQSNLPKVLHQVAGKPMLQHVIDTVSKLDISKIIVVVGHGAEKVQELIKKPINIELQYVMQDQQLGTGHAVKQALPLLIKDQPVLVLYGDVPLIQAQTLMQLYLNTKNKLGLLTVEYENPTSYGRIIRDNGNITAIVEEKDANEEQKAIKEINTGIMLLPAKHLDDWLHNLNNNNAQQEYYLTDVIALAVQSGFNVQSSKMQYGEWESFGVNSKTQLSRVERCFQVHQAQILTNNGVQLADSARIDIRGNLSTENDVFIDVGCVFEGDVHLSQGVSVGPYCVIKDSSIAENTTIDAFSHIQNSIIGKNAQIGPYARLRPGTIVGNSSKIGNFVEIKNTKIGIDTKVNHLSYIGDALIGNNVNIGAGTITCNYDGASKHTTTIQDGAFIGSDCQLIAPVTVEKNATLGAGTTLTSNAPFDQLTISRVKQVTVKDWKRPQKIAKQSGEN